MAIIGTSVSEAARLLQEGSLLAIPTETVYGLAGNALNEAVVTQIFIVKNRPSFDPLIIHTHQLSAVYQYISSFPTPLLTLAEAFWPGPLTLLLPKLPIIPDLVTSGLNRVAVRVPNHPLSLDLLRNIDFPLAAPSANPFGYVSPTTPQHVANQLGDKIPYILDGGYCQVGVESTIVGMEEGEVVIYRKGGLSIESIEVLVGKVRIQAHSSSQPAAPGMLKSHYAPTKKLTILSPNIFLQQKTDATFGYIGFDTIQPAIAPEFQVLLSTSGDLDEAARNLFAALRQADTWEVDEIFVTLVPEHGLGRAINDRLRRAAAR